MLEVGKPTFDKAVFLASAGPGRRIFNLQGKQTFFLQGEPADSVFYLQSGRARLTVVSQNGKEATINLISPGEFVGEESLASAGTLRTATATSVTDCTAIKIEREEMIRVMHEEPALSEAFLKIRSCSRCAHRVRSCRPALRLQRKTFGKDTPVDGGLWRSR